MARTFHRSKARYKPQPTVLVICEDSKSAKRYLEDATHYFRVHVTVEISHCGKTDPKGIVADAVKRQKDFDRVFCAIDRDTHGNFDEAIALAKSEPKIVLIRSYPCFEFWYLLHFGQNRRPYIAGGNKSAGERLVADLKACPGMAEYCKGSTSKLFEALLPRLRSARDVSPQVLAQAIREENLNPSTEVHILIDYFEGLMNPLAS